MLGGVGCVLMHAGGVGGGASFFAVDLSGGEVLFEVTLHVLSASGLSFHFSIASAIRIVQLIARCAKNQNFMFYFYFIVRTDG